MKLLLASLPGCIYAQEIRCFYLPVSLTQVPITEERISLRPVLMQLGGISPFTYSLKLFEAYQKSYSSFDLFLHGFISEEFICQADQCEKIPVLSSVPLGAENLPKIVSRSDIGFLYYNGNSDLNYYNIRNASGQLVEFLRLGKPIIAMGKNNLQSLIEEHKIGIYLDDIDRLADAVTIIMDNYVVYSTACKALFDRQYDLSLYMHTISRWFEKNHSG
jgi:glycosyltransferase involved in cell wall biosynthesis